MSIRPRWAVVLALTLGACAQPLGSAPTERDPARYAHPDATPQRHVMDAIPEYKAGQYDTSGCYNIGDERIKFRVYVVTSDKPADWDAMANATASTCDTTVKWDDQWYWYALPEDTIKNLMLLWLNIDSNTYGYVIVRMSANFHLQVASNNNHELRRVPSDSTHGFSWRSNGYLIRIQVHNPPSRFPWRANDFWFRFVK
jgi:hypothetical protein